MDFSTKFVFIHGAWIFPGLELESPKRRIILEIKTIPSEDDEQNSGGGGSVSGFHYGTAFSGIAEKERNK